MPLSHVKQPLRGKPRSHAHAVQLGLFEDDANCPVAHGAQVRSAVAFGDCITLEPATHTVCTRHELWPADI
jgi:hypothetical protein